MCVCACVCACVRIYINGSLKPLIKISYMQREQNGERVSPCNIPLLLLKKSQKSDWNFRNVLSESYIDLLIAYVPPV